MRERMVVAIGLLCLAGTAIAQDGDRAERRRAGAPHFYTEPSEVIAAEIAFARRAQDKGQWHAYRDTMAAGAMMFVPQRVDAAQWLRGRKEPPEAARWQPREAWMSCDGSAALVDGVWQQGKEHGWFSTVWQRQKNGGYKWILQDGDREAAASVATDGPVSDTIAAHVADCPRGVAGKADRAKIARWLAQPPAGGAPDIAKKGSSQDSTLHWETTAEADGAHNLSAWMWKDGDMQQVHDTEVSAPGGH